VKETPFAWGPYINKLDVLRSEVPSSQLSVSVDLRYLSEAEMLKNVGEEHTNSNLARPYSSHTVQG